MSNEMQLVFRPEELGEFYPVVNQLMACGVKKERARLTTVLTGYLRSIYWLRTSQTLPAKLISIQVRWDASVGSMEFRFEFGDRP